MWIKLKKWGSCLLILVLLPYVVTVFISGPGTETSSCVDQIYIQAEVSGDTGEKTGEEEEKDRQIIEIPLKEYGVGVMAREIPAEYAKEALKAQAVLVRTDIYRQIQEGKGSEPVQGAFWDREDMEKVWEGKARTYREKLEKAWEETQGIILTYNGEPAYAPFFRLSCGCTRDGKEVFGNENYPYLKIVDCPADLKSEEQLQTSVTEDMDAEVTSTDKAGYVLQVRVGKETMSGEEFRRVYDLPSACFTLQRYNGKMRIVTSGAGHGLGMSQYSADHMAKEGQTFEEILSYFFEGCELKEVAEILQKTEG